MGVEICGSDCSGNGCRCAANGCCLVVADGVRDFDQMGAADKSAVRSEPTVPAGLIGDLLMAIFVAIDAFLRQLMVAEVALATVCHESPNDAIADV